MDDIDLSKIIKEQKTEIERLGSQLDIIEECLALAKKTIEENKDLLVLIAEALLKYETITAEEIEFLVKYGSLDAYDVYKKNSEMLAQATKEETTTEENNTVVEENNTVVEENNTVVEENKEEVDNHGNE